MKPRLFAVAVLIIGYILYLAFFGTPLHAQRTNTIYVDQMRGSTVAAKTINAQAQCLAAVKCVLVFDPILGGYALGTMPSKGGNEFWADYAGITGVSDLGGTVSSGLADPGGAGPIKRTTAGVTALANSSDLTGVSYCLDTSSSSTAYACSLSPAIASYATGACHRFKAGLANTAAATINFNALGAKTIKKVAGGVTTDLVANDIRAGQVVTVCYDGTNMQMQSQLGNSATTNITSPHAFTMESQTDGHSYTLPDNDAFIAGNGFIYRSAGGTLGVADLGNAVLMDCNAPCTLTLPGGLPVANFSVVAIGSAAVTISLSGSISYNGVHSNLTLTKQAITAWWDGNNYWGTVPIVASTNVTVTPASNQIGIAAAGGSGGTPGGADTNVQYNDASAFGGDSGFTYNKTTHVLNTTGGFQAGATGGTAANGIDIGSANVGCITFEGATADAFETKICPTDPTADRSVMFPDADTKVSISAQQLTWAGPTAARTYTLPDANVSLAPLASPTFTGKVTTAASASGGAGLNLPHGAAPSSPANGDCWTTTAGLYCYINGSTVGPFATSGGTNTQTVVTADGTGTGSANYQTLTAGANITLTPNAGAHTMTIAASGGSSSPATFFQSSIETAVSSAGNATNGYILWGVTLNSGFTLNSITVYVATVDTSANRYAVCIYDGSGNLQAKAEGLNFGGSAGAFDLAVTGAPVTLAAGRYYVAVTGNANVAKVGIGSASYWSDMNSGTIGSGGGTTCAALPLRSRHIAPGLLAVNFGSR
jgi:hypothetical protein